jgi:DNA-binding transcriptional LysR family regulator
LGLQEDLGEAVLPGVLGRFARAHPKVRIEACVARSAELRERLDMGALDLALIWEVEGKTSLVHGERLARLPLQWIGPASPEALDVPWWAQQQRGAGPRKAKEPLPLVLLDAPCPLRDVVTHTLDRSGIAWRHAFTSTSLAALWAATSAGLGLSVRTRFGLPAHVRVLDRSGTRLPALPSLALAMYRAQAEPEPPVARLADLLREAMAAHLGDTNL